MPWYLNCDLCGGAIHSTNYAEIKDERKGHEGVSFYYCTDSTWFEQGSCYDRAFALLEARSEWAQAEGTAAAKAPQAGYEWRLVPVERAPRSPDEGEDRRASWRENHARANGPGGIGTGYDERPFLDWQTARILTSAGIATIDQLTAMSADELLRVKGIGGTRVNKIMRALEARGLTLAEPTSPEPPVAPSHPTTVRDVLRGLAADMASRSAELEAVPGGGDDARQWLLALRRMRSSINNYVSRGPHDAIPLQPRRDY